MITEPDVTITDYGLAIECAVFAYLLSRQTDRGHPLKTWLTVFFGSIALASFTGGTVHGFFLNEKTAGYAILWPATLIAIGVTALMAWTIAASILLSPKMARWISAAAAVGFALYALAVLFLIQEFWIAIAVYLSSVIFLLVALSLAYLRTQDKKLLIGVLGLGLTFVAALVQQAQISLDPIYFNHNAFYHLIQGIALFMIFWAARFLTAAQRAQRRCLC
jgi:hypothetical protein